MKFFHITWVTHNSRISERMRVYAVTFGEPVLFNDEDRSIMFKILATIIAELKIESPAHNVLSDHIHIVLKCHQKEISNIVRKLKSKSTYLFKNEKRIKENYNVWAQKYNVSIIKTEKELINVVNYVENNHFKHGLRNVFWGNNVACPIAEDSCKR